MNNDNKYDNLEEMDNFLETYIHEKMLNVSNYYRNTNQNYHEVHLTPVRIAIINKSTNDKFWRGCGEKRSLLHCWWECKWVKPLWKTV